MDCRAEAKFQPSSRYPWAKLKETPRSVYLGLNQEPPSLFPQPGPLPQWGSPSQPLFSNTQPDLHPGILPAPDPPRTTPGPLTMTFLSTGLFFSQFRCLLGVGTRAGERRGAGCGVGERFHTTPHPVYAHSGTTAAEGSSPSFLPLICQDLRAFEIT